MDVNTPPPPPPEPVGNMPTPPPPPPTDSKGVPPPPQAGVVPTPPPEVVRPPPRKVSHQKVSHQKVSILYEEDEDDDLGPSLMPPTKKKKLTPRPDIEVPDIEVIMKRRREADELAKKPVFISKKKRLEMEAAKKAAEEKKKAEEDQKWQEELQRRRNGTSQKNGVNGVARNSIETGEVPTGPAAMRNGAKQDTPAPMADDPRWNDPEWREHYMGPTLGVSKFSAEKKRKRTMNKKFNFDWDPADDTTLPEDPRYPTPKFPTMKPSGYSLDYMDEAIEEKARLIEISDPVNGAQRAAKVREDHRQAKAMDRNCIGKGPREKPLDEMESRDWRIMKEDHNISIKGSALPNPMRNWDESRLPNELLKVIKEVGYKEPTAVQMAAIPIALQNRDLIGVAVTGSGKTAAFLLPLLTYIRGLPPLDEITKGDGPYGIILAPTRELAQQIEQEAKKFAAPLGFNCVSLVGGHSIESQIFAMRDGAELVIATPGRLVDMIDRHAIVFNQCCYVIMDEADKMIDMGFEEEVNKILNALPVGNQKPDNEDAENAAAMSQFLGGRDRYRQTMMYTATMPPPIERIAKKYLRRPAVVTIGTAGEAVDTVEQRAEFIPSEDRRKIRLEQILRSGQFQPPIIVFVNNKTLVSMIERDIRGWGFRVIAMHGNKKQHEREAAINDLKNGYMDILVATDIAARGIDIPDVSLVIQFTMALTIEQYTHRIGRTGRAGKSGVAITFWGNEDADKLYDLKMMLQKSSISRVPNDLRQHESAQMRGGRRIEAAPELTPPEPEKGKSKVPPYYQGKPNSAAHNTRHIEENKRDLEKAMEALAAQASASQGTTQT